MGGPTFWTTDMPRQIHRLTRSSRLTPEQAARVAATRAQIADELPSIHARAKILLAEARAVRAVCSALRDARHEQGLTLGDVERLTGIDRSALSKLERGERPNVTFETLGRYAAALGKQLHLNLEDAPMAG
jgi:DNA-binding Xre family transcriptional regulator